MDNVLRQVEQQAQGILAMSTQEQLGLLLLTLTIVGIVGLCVWCCMPERKNEETRMAPPVQLKASDKGMLAIALTNGIEDRVMFHKLNRKTARRIYDAVGRALDIPELRYTGDLKATIKSRRAHKNGSGKKPLPIPGDKPIQDIKPNGFKPIVAVNKEKMKSLFKPRTAKTTA